MWMPFRNSRPSVFGVVWCAVLQPVCPGDDFGLAAFVFGVGLDPGKDFGVAFRQDGFHGFGINAGEFKKALVKRAVVVILAVLAGKRGPAFVEHSGQ